MRTVHHYILCKEPVMNKSIRSRWGSAYFSQQFKTDKLLHGKKAWGESILSASSRRNKGKEYLNEACCIMMQNVFFLQLSLERKSNFCQKRHILHHSAINHSLPFQSLLHCLICKLANCPRSAEYSNSEWPFVSITLIDSCWYNSWH